MSKNEYSLECEKCNLYNLENGIIEKGKIYCHSCYNKIEEKRSKWRYYKKYKVYKIPYTFKKKDGTKVTFMSRKVKLRNLLKSGKENKK